MGRAAVGLAGALVLAIGLSACAERPIPLSLYSRIGVSFDVLPEGLDALLTVQDRRPKKLKARAKK